MTNQTKMHNMTDLEAYYDRQLAPVGSIVEELVRVERQIIQLIAKVIPHFEYNICTSYRISP